MPMRPTREVHYLSGYLIEGAVWGAPSTQNLFLFLFRLPASLFSACNLEQKIAGISISIHSRTVAANSNNFQTHPVCHLLSTKEINPSEIIFNNNVIQNGINKIVKTERFCQFLKIGLEENFILKSARPQPHYITQGGGGVEYTSIYSHKIWHRRIAVIVHERSIHQSVRFGGKQNSLIGLRVFRGD